MWKKKKKKGNFNLGNEYHLQKLCLGLVSEVLRPKLVILDPSELNAGHRLTAITLARLEGSELERASDMKNLLCSAKQRIKENLGIKESK